MLAALGLAWPHPLAIMAVAAIDCVALVLAAFRWRLPALHAGAIACATLAYLTGFHVIYSGLPLFTSDAATMLQKIISAPERHGAGRPVRALCRRLGSCSPGGAAADMR